MAQARTFLRAKRALPLLSSRLNCLTSGLASAPLIGDRIHNLLETKRVPTEAEEPLSLLIKQLSSSARDAQKVFLYGP